MDYNKSSYNTIITTFVASILIPKLGLDISQSGMLIMIIQHLSTYFNNIDKIIENIQIDNIFIYLFGFGLIIVLYYFISWIFRLYKKRYIQINLYEYNKIKIFQQYMKYNPSYFNKKCNTNFGNPKMLARSIYDADNYDHYNYLKICNNIVTDQNSKILIDDKYLNLKGYMYWKIYEDTIKKKKRTGYFNNAKEEYVTQDVSLPYIEINFRTKNIEPEEVFNKIEKYVNEKNMNIKTYHCKIIYQNNEARYNNNIMYSGKKKSLNYLKKIYIDSFFHNEKDKLWHWIKNIGTDSSCFKKYGQGSRASLLLYGPPGTGKSSFAYRIAMALNRNLISLDLREIKSKYDVYNILNNPIVGEGISSYKNCVYIFDEFDMVVTNLYYKDTIERAKINSKIDKLEDVKDKIKNNDFNVIEKMITNKNNDIFEYYNLDKDDNSLCLRDLLEIFQGPCPNDGMIIIATTNKFEEINKKCPALFRPGRLTPIKFDYPSKDIIKEITKYYFNKELEINLPKIIEKPTSQIIEIALSSNSPGNGGFKNFQKEITEILD